MNFKERMLYLTDLKAENAVGLEKNTNGTVTEDANGNVKVTFDLREMLRRKMEEYNIKESQLADFLGLTRQQKWNFMKGNVGLPYDKTERLVFLLFGDIQTEED